MRHSRRCSIAVIAAILLAAGWVAALLAAIGGATVAGEHVRASRGTDSRLQACTARGPEAGDWPASGSHLHRRRRLHRLPRR